MWHNIKSVAADRRIDAEAFHLFATNPEIAKRYNVAQVSGGHWEVSQWSVDDLVNAFVAKTAAPVETGDGLHLPVVAGRFVSRSNADLERACLVHIANEQAKLLPDNALIATLADCARLTREYSDAMNRR